MKPLLRILHLEDDPNDAVLIRNVLATAGISAVATRVQNEKDFVAALEKGDVDLVLSDFSMPGFDGVSATEIVRSRWPHIPFIFVSGTLGEERAIRALKSGAKDYVLKDDLGRLGSAIQHVMEQGDEETWVMPVITTDHKIAMACLPLDGRWQTEAQLIRQTKLGNRTARIYRDLVNASFCEQKIMPILSDITGSEDFMRTYRTTWKMRRAYGKAAA